ncbi:hypothetical protein XfCFBP8082_03000 [Xylella fastidiosa subsp. fastidiosa]|nr:hypothetical protein XFLM_05435 [Xylella fastidiosa subsp. fastidiosa GB514]KAF0571011.1 hypothetical protein P305_07005 [Xylella fastidiosa subsp. fastidiosa Mus-1]KGM21334.1 hypothetical protein JT24_00215 [Xylella fastidiosa]RUA36419.1 hypothetical protein DX877_08330 [Xylella fastidiosa subsp. fastidiosa]RUA36590.1 hypothetical protein DX878_07955 [Xylella fastidiosa subsp. fastidiosa]
MFSKMRDQIGVKFILPDSVGMSISMFQILDKPYFFLICQWFLVFDDLYVAFFYVMSIKVYRPHRVAWVSDECLCT